LANRAYTQQADDPDLVLSAPFPITRASYRRKFWRDIIGRTGYQQRKAQIFNTLGDPSWPVARRLRRLWEKLGPQLVANGVLLAVFALAGVWWAYPLLWLVPLLTWFMVITRIRNIAEHAVVPDSNDPFRNTRTTEVSLLERAFVAPYWVNYHLEHHLLFWLPCYRPPVFHAALMKGQHAARIEVRRGYLEVMRMATSRPEA
jgi:fatty acid desaturase